MRTLQGFEGRRLFGAWRSEVPECIGVEGIRSIRDSGVFDRDGEPLRTGSWKGLRSIGPSEPLEP